MPKYFIQASLSLDGLRGFVKEGGTARRAAFKDAVEGMGGKLETYYFCFGDNDVMTVIDMPDNVSAAAISVAVALTGAVKPKITVLITPEEMDRAVKKKVNFRGPGQPK